MTKLNPYTNKPTRFITKDEINKFPEDFNFTSSEFAKIDKEVRCSFEFGVHQLVASQSPNLQKRASDYRTLLEKIPVYKEEGNFNYWISELIQNAHDATWLINDVELGPTNFEFEVKKDVFTFSHDGRPPQWIEYLQNEVAKMTEYATSKYRKYSTEGQFGIGFKLWTLMFNRIELRYGYLELKIEIDEYPKYQINWFDDPVDQFRITASQPKSTTISDLLTSLTKEQMWDMFDRSLKGLLVRPHPFNLRVKSPSDEDEIGKFEPKDTTNIFENSPFKIWEIKAEEHHELPQNIITYSRKIGDLEHSGEKLSEILKNEIESDEARQKLFAEDVQDDEKPDIAQVVHNTMESFHATIAIVPKGEFEGTIFNSLFPIPGSQNENLTNTGMHFISKFAMDEERKTLSNKTGKKERNEVLMLALLQCYFSMMDKIKEREIRSALHITEDFYFKLLGIFSDTENDLGGLDEFVDHITGLLENPGYNEDVSSIIGLLSIYPLIQPDEYASYVNVKQLRPEVGNLILSDDEDLKSWGEAIIEPNEGVTRGDDGELKQYNWKVDKWNASFSSEYVWKLRGGPDNMDLDTFLHRIESIDGFTCPNWLMIPLDEVNHNGIIWRSMEFLDQHLIVKTNSEERQQLSEFEEAIKNKLSEHDVYEYTINSAWMNYVSDKNPAQYIRLVAKITEQKNLYQKRVQRLIERSEDKGETFFLELLENHPQSEAKFPFFLLAKEEDLARVVKLDAEIPECILFQEQNTSYVVKCQKTANHWKVDDTMNPVATVLGSSDRPTHLFVGKESTEIIQDLEEIIVLPQATIGSEASPDSAAVFFGLSCEFPTITPFKVREIALKWLNKIPHIGVSLKLTPGQVSDNFEVIRPTSMRRNDSPSGNDQYIVVENGTTEIPIHDEKSHWTNTHLKAKVAQALINTNDWRERNLDTSNDKQNHWMSEISEGRFAVLFRISSYPSVIAENLIHKPSKLNYLRYLRSLRFNHMDLNPTFLLLHLGNLYHPKRNGKVVQGNRRIRIVCQKFTASELRALENANSIMSYLEENKAYVGCLPESPSEDLKKMFTATPNYTSEPLRNTAAAEWNLDPGKLSSMVFRHALFNKMALLPDTILLKNAPYFQQNPVQALLAVNLLNRLDHQFITNDEFPLKEIEAFNHFFSYVPGRPEKPILLRELIESIILKDEEVNQEPNALFAHSLEALVLAQHQFLNLIDETNHDHYWRDLAAIEFENYKTDEVTWSEEFAQLLDHRKRYTANTIKFVDQLGTLKEFSIALRRLKDNGEKSNRRRGGKTMQVPNPPITPRTNVYIVREDEYDSCFPLTTKSTWLSEHSQIYSNPASIVLTATTEEWSKMKDKFPDEFSQHNTARRILDEVRTILQAFIKAHSNAGEVGQRNDAGDESQRRAVEFLRRGVLRYLADKHSSAESGVATGDLLNWAYDSIDVRTVSIEQANTESMFPQSDDEFLSNMLIGPCGIGWSLDNGRLTMTLGPWLNRDWGGEKLNWAKDLFAELLNGLSLTKIYFGEKYDIQNEQLSFLASLCISGFDKTTTWLRTYQDDLLPIDTAFDDFFTKGEWQNVNKIQTLVNQILDKINRECSEGRLQEAAPSVFKQMYPESLICTISGYVVPDPIGSNRLHTVRLRRPDTATHQPVLDEPTPPNLKGWESIGNTLYVSDRASQTGQRLEGWRLRPPHGKAGSFVTHLADNIEHYYADSSDEFIRIPDVVSFKHEDGHDDARFDLQLHKLHSLYIIAYDKYCQTVGDS